MKVRNNVLPFRRRLTKERALQLIRKAVRESQLGWSEHGLEQMLERDIDDTQVLVVVSKAEIRTGPRWDEEHQDWVCTMRKLVAGRLVTVVLGIDEDDDVLVITAH